MGQVKGELLVGRGWPGVIEDRSALAVGGRDLS
jgi:hypothetical protein